MKFTPTYMYYALCTNVVDGDTFDFMFDIGFHVHIKERIRLKGVDTEELRSGTPETKAQALKAKARSAELILNRVCVVHSQKMGAYGRWEGEVFYLDANDELKSLRDTLIAEGFEKVLHPVEPKEVV